MQKKPDGFTLIELMITVAIVGILVAVAYPSYTNYVKRTHRAEIVELLSEQPQTLERYFSQNGNYNITSGLSAGNAYYTIAFVTPQPAALTYTLTATPIATAMMNGDSCGSFVITNTGARSNTGMAAGTTSASCWGR